MIFSPPQAKIFDIWRFRDYFSFVFCWFFEKISKISQNIFMTDEKKFLQTKIFDFFFVSNEKNTDSQLSLLNIQGRTVSKFTQKPVLSETKHCGVLDTSYFRIIGTNSCTLVWPVVAKLENDARASFSRMCGRGRRGSHLPILLVSTLKSVEILL